MDFEVPKSGFWDASRLKPGNLKEGKIVPRIGPNTVRSRISYTYSAEAAFTQSSRWRSGNHLLKVWTNEAWRDRSLEFRRNWEEKNCDTVRKFGQEFEKQRTAALTTPVTPVMYTECGTTLFSRFEGGSGTVPISISALGPKGGGTVERFVIKGGGTTCKKGGFREFRKDIKWSELGKAQKYSPGAGWGVTPKVVERKVSIQGESASISCKVNMSVRTALKPQVISGVKLAGFGTLKSRGTHEFDWESLEIPRYKDRFSAKLTFDEKLSMDSIGDEEKDFELKSPSGAGSLGVDLNEPLNTIYLKSSAGGIEEGDEVTIAIVGTIKSQE
ncbi:MAG: hypothetical protein SVS85_02665, partial [Candidatus Nanohaloarchaea archaeon]|nr:hypothetical protein [Candidatus Nanohaloarchaea archaeon]